MAPFKLAIVGAGPSAFYVASRLLSLLPRSGPNSVPFRIHMYDRLWAPHGLVRYGVAPDHPEVKNCTNKFDLAASDPRFRFFGNVDVSETTDSQHGTIPHALNLSWSSICANYTHLLLATGCTVPIRHPMEPSPYCVSALSLVHWYTNHPSRPPAPPLDKVKDVSIIGHGNVSLDVARILLINPETLSKYDVPESVLDVLSRSTVRHVSIIGRRGPFEASFTTKELREMMNLPKATLTPNVHPDLLKPPPNQSISRQQSRLIDIIKKGSSPSTGNSTAKTWELDFFRSPIALSPPTTENPFAALTLAHTTLDPETRRAVLTNDTSTKNTSLVITSLGFRAEPIPAPFYDPSLGHHRVVRGRVVPLSSDAHLDNVYASGWAATGAKGVLASTMMNAYAVAETIISDWAPGGTTTTNRTSAARSGERWAMNPEPHPEDPPPEVQAGLKDGLVTEYGDWKVIDEEETRRGEAKGKERERMGWEDARTFLASRKLQ